MKKLIALITLAFASTAFAAASAPRVHVQLKVAQPPVQAAVNETKLKQRAAKLAKAKAKAASK
jgi:hypothetical protein